jgi:hypothetical protein
MGKLAFPAYIRKIRLSGYIKSKDIYAMWGIFIGMDYWYDIIENHDPPKIKGSKSKDHGTFSQKVSVILLIYLAFGADYSSGIAEYFSELKDRMYHCPSVLMSGGKISSVLKRMNEEKLVVLLKKVSIGANARYYYVLNPQILQSPIRDSTTYIKHNGFPFKIPPETIESFLGWLALKQAGIIDKGRQEQLDKQVRQARQRQADRILVDGSINSKMVDYCDFLSFIEAEARKWDLQRGPSNQQPALGDLIHDYIFEMKKSLWEWESCVD